jgi:hypothetical protein
MALLSQEDQLLLINKMTDEYQTILNSDIHFQQCFKAGCALLAEIQQLAKPRYFDECNFVSLKKIGNHLEEILSSFDFKYAS